jgi:UDP-glucose:(heptosyl)LPS alpha-1,3-glucosyltransferase
MRIAIVIPKMNKLTGAARIAASQASSLQKQCHDVTILCEKTPPDPSVFACAFVSFSKFGLKGRLGRWLFRQQVERFLRKNPFDLVIGHGDILHQDFLFLHNCVHLYQELVFPHDPQALKSVRHLHAKILKQGTFKKVVVNSKLMQNDIHTRFGIPLECIVIEYPHFDQRQFKVREYPASFYRQKLRIKNTPYCIGLITSGEVEKRGVDLLLSAYASLAQATRDQVNLIIVGKNMKKKCEALGLATVGVEFFEMQSNVQDFYASLDLYILPARLEEFGLSPLEAAVTGVPVLLSQNVGCLEILPQAYQEIALKDISPSSLATEIEKFYQSGFQFERSQELAQELASLCRDKRHRLIDHVIS